MPKGPQGQSEEPVKRHLNAAEKRARKAADLQLFVQRYGRKAQKGTEPNDRRYDRRLEKAVKTMPPETLDRIIRDDED
jgi:hypothetical protein